VPAAGESTNKNARTAETLYMPNNMPPPTLHTKKQPPNPLMPNAPPRAPDTSDIIQPHMHHTYVQVPLKLLNKLIENNNILYPNPSLGDPRPTIRNLRPTHNLNEIINGDEIIAVATGIRIIKGYGESTHMWDMQDMRRIRASCMMKKSGAWMLVRRKGPRTLASRCSHPTGLRAIQAADWLGTQA
jgi:hypothetical protein